MTRQYLLLIRPHQWTKNLFVIAPLFFSNNLFNGPLLVSALIMTIAFCLMSSAVYCINDACDAESDRKHPVKRNRPIAAGAISAQKGIWTAAILAVASLFTVSLGRHHAPCAILILTGYALINLLYCLWLKHYAVIDVMCIATGFVMRVAAGGYVTDVKLSQWIVLMTFLLALFLALGKRYDDLVIYQRTGTLMRANIKNYNMPFVLITIAIVAAVIIVCYIMYTLSDDVAVRTHSDHLYLTTIWVIAAVIHYLQTIIVRKQSGSPTERLLTDHTLQACLAGWTISFFVILYLK